jgi:ribosome maturation factor RimP
MACFFMMMMTQPQTDKLTPRQCQRIAAALLPLVEPLLAQHQATAIATEMVFEEGQYHLRLFVGRLDKQAIGLDECAVLSLATDAVVNGMIELSTLNYCFEVSSPGLFRALHTPKELQYFVGKPVCLVPQAGNDAATQEAVKAFLAPCAFTSGVLSAYDEASHTATLTQEEGGLGFAVALSHLPQGVELRLNPTLHKLAAAEADALADEMADEMTAAVAEGDAAAE